MLTYFTGENVTYLMPADYIYDILNNEHLLIKDYEYPKWASKGILDSLEDLHEAKFRMFSQTKAMQRLRLGVFLNELTERIRNAAAPPETEKGSHLVDEDDIKEVKKLNIYSTVS